MESNIICLEAMTDLEFFSEMFELEFDKPFFDPFYPKRIFLYSFLNKIHHLIFWCTEIS